jgi:hypothetical protein
MYILLNNITVVVILYGEAGGYTVLPVPRTGKCRETNDGSVHSGRD